MNILYNDFGRLRSVWRLLIYALPFYFLTNALAFAIKVLYQLTLPWEIPHRPFVFELIFRSGLLIFALGLGYVCARGLEDLPWRSLGLTLHKGWFKDLAIGFGLGFAALALAVAIAIKGFNFSLSKDGIGSVVTSMIGSAA